MDSGMEAQLTATKSWWARGELRWIWWAKTSLPVPDSPDKRTVTSVWATRSDNANNFLTWSFLQTNWLASCRSIMQCSTCSVNCLGITGLDKTSIAPNFMALTAIATWPSSTMTNTGQFNIAWWKRLKTANNKPASSPTLATIRPNWLLWPDFPRSCGWLSGSQTKPASVTRWVNNARPWSLGSTIAMTKSSVSIKYQIYFSQWLLSKKEAKKIYAINYGYKSLILGLNLYLPGSAGNSWAVNNLTGEAWIQRL